MAARAKEESVSVKSHDEFAHNELYCASSRFSDKVGVVFGVRYPQSLLQVCLWWQQDFAHLWAPPFACRHHRQPVGKHQGCQDVTTIFIFAENRQADLATLSDMHSSVSFSHHALRRSLSANATFAREPTPTYTRFASRHATFLSARKLPCEPGEALSLAVSHHKTNHR